MNTRLAVFIYLHTDTWNTHIAIMDMYIVSLVKVDGLPSSCGESDNSSSHLGKGGINCSDGCGLDCGGWFGSQPSELVESVTMEESCLSLQSYLAHDFHCL